MEKVLTKYDFKQLVGPKGLVVFFYPRAMSDDCSVEVAVFNQRYKDIEKLGYNIVGISTDPVEANEQFSKEHDLQFPLISDLDRKITMKFNNLTTVVRNGKEIERPLRTTYVVDVNGNIKEELPKVSAITSASDVVKALEKLEK